MKTLSKLRVFALIFFAIAFVSCDNNDDPVDNTITGLAVRNSNLKILVQALTRADLATTLQGVGPFTVFAPTDAAFTAFLKTTPYATINDVPKDVLTQILLNHVVSGSVKSTALSTGYIKTLAKGSASTSNTLSMYVDLTSGVKLNGVAKVTTADVMASNGVIHVVDGVIGLPTIVTHAMANPMFSTLVSALTYNPQSGFAGVLSGTTSSPFTVFAPNDAAFAKLPAGTVDGLLKPENLDKLKSILTYHVVAGKFEAATVIDAINKNNGKYSVTTVQGGTIVLSLKDGKVILTDAKGGTATVILADVAASNGVIHAIDTVVMPK